MSDGKFNKIFYKIDCFANRWIVTAAHCIDRREKTKAHFGIDANGEFSEIVEVKRKNQFAHPGYDDDKFINDIGKSCDGNSIQKLGRVMKSAVFTKSRCLLMWERELYSNNFTISTSLK